MGGSKSSSSSSTSNYTNQQDNRVAASDYGIALGYGAELDSSTNLDGGSSINYFTEVTDGGAFDFGTAVSNNNTAATIAALNSNTAAADAARRTTEAALGVLGDSVRAGYDFAGGVSADGFNLASAVTGESFEFADASLEGLLAGQEILKEATNQANETAFGFAGNVLAGYEKASLEESERNFRQVMVAAMVLGGLAIVAWAYVKGK